MRTVITNGVLARHDGITTADIAFEHGRIVEIGEKLPRAGAKIVEAKACIVMPGGIDGHVRLSNRDMDTGNAAATFRTLTRAALYGGTTAVTVQVDRPRTPCPPARQMERMRELTAQSAVDYRIRPVLICSDDDAQDDLEGQTLLRLNQNGARNADLLEYLQQLAGGLPPSVRCENRAVAMLLARQAEAEGRTGAAAWPGSRPDYCEEDALRRMLTLVRATHAPLLLEQLSTASALALVRAARQDGLPVLAATAPHYLLLDDSGYEEGAAEGLKYVTRPPLRKRPDMAALWEGLKDGMIDMVSSAHSNTNFAQKWESSGGNVFRCPTGVPGVETRLPLLFSEGVLHGRLTIPRFVQIVAETPARLLGFSAKGRLEAGYDADIVVMDPHAAVTLHAAQLHQPSDYTPFEGMTVRGRVRDVWLRGQAVIRDGECCTDDNSGLSCD